MITCILFTLSCAFANDMDETLAASDLQDELQMGFTDDDLTQHQSDEPLTDSIVYFNASAARDGDGSQSNPYKYYRSGRIDYATTAYFADGVYDIDESSSIYSDSNHQTTFIGQSRQNTVLRSNLDNKFDFIVNSNSYFVLKDLTMVNVHINNQANLVADKVIFRDSVSFDPEYRPGLYHSYIYHKYNSTCGGVIICDTPSGKTTTLNIDNCYFINNKASSGGAIAAYNTIANIKNSVFYNSSASIFGGAIYSLSSNINISDSYFKLSRAKYGGAVYGNHSKFNIENSIFNLSQAYSFGGVVGFILSEMNVNNTLFTDYASLSDAGGAIYAFKGILNVISSSFRNGHSNFGGAVCNLKTNSSIAFTEFINNDAKYYGGSIFNMYGTTDIQRNNFINSHAGGSGGSIFNRMSDSFYLLNNLFINSTANYGAMVFIDGDNSRIVEKGNVYKDIFNLVAVYRTSLNGAEKTFLSNYLTFSVSNNGEYLTPLINENTQPTANYGDVNFAIYDVGHTSSAIYTDLESQHKLRFNLTKYNSNFEDVGIELYIINQNGDAISLGSLGLSDNRNYTAADLTDIYFKDLVLFLLSGNIFDIDYFESVPLFNYSSQSPVNLPYSYDSRDYGYITSVKDQKDGGNCWAFAGVATLEACIKKATGIDYDFSEENVKNLMAEYSLFGSDEEINDGGNLNMFIAYLASWFGPTSDENDVYDDYSSLSVIYNSLFHIQNVYIIPDRQNSFDNERIKRAVMECGAVSVGIVSEAHAVTIVGWDDEYSGEDFLENKSTGAWIIKNSWGPDWQDNGFGYLSYEHDIINAYTFIFNDVRGYTDIYQYDFSGKSGMYYLTSSDVVYYKNSFTAVNDEILSAFSTYFDEPTNYTAFVYLNGELVRTQEGYAEMGYYTIALNNEVVLNRGDKFEIAFKISNPAPVYFPLCVANEVNSVIFSENISFLSTDGIHWQDLYNLTSGVACIKAFTRSKTIIEVPITVTQFESVNVGEKAMIQVSLPQYYVLSGLRHYLDGFVTFTINNQYHYARVVDGKACLNLTFDSQGVYNLTAQYKSNKEISKVVSFIFNVVNDSHSQISIHAGDVSKFYGGSEKYVVAVNDNGNALSGVSVKISANGKSYTRTTDSNGEVILDLSDLPVGTYDVIAEYGGKSCSSKFRVKSTIATSDVSGVYMNTYVSASFSDSKGYVLSNRQVTFSLGSDSFKATTDDNGFAKAKIDLAVGNYVLTVTNPVTGEKKQLTVEILKADSQCQLSVSQSGSVVTIEAVISPSQATGCVYFAGLGSVREVDVENGVARLILDDLSPGDYNVSATYSGDDNFRVSNDNEIFSVLKNPYHLLSYNYWGYYGLSGTMARILDDENHGVEGEIVKATILNKTYTTITDEDGDAVFDLNFLDVGNYSVLFEYRGQSFFYKVFVNSTIDMDDFSCEYMKSKVSAKFINPFDINNTEGLNVKFKINGKEFTTTTNALGYAGVDVDLGVGTHTITAINLCNGEKKQSTLTIYKATPTVTISKYPAGTHVVLTAVLTPINVTGNVIFTVGGRKYSSAIKDGSAAIAVDDLDMGSYESYARYSGDTNFNSAESDKVEFSIAPATIRLSAPDFTKYYGSSQDFTVRLTADDAPIVGVIVKFIFNGDVSYLKTNINKSVSVGVNLPPGSYVFQTSYGDINVLSNITIKSTVECSDLTCSYSNSKVSATFYDSDGNLVNNEWVTFDIEGRKYSALISNGFAASNVSLDAETYDVKVVNPVTNETKYFVLEITKATPEIDLRFVEEDDADVLVASLPTRATGTIRFLFDDGTSYPCGVGGGLSRMTIYAPGNYTVNVVYSGDYNYNQVSKSIKISVADRSPKFVASPLTKVYGDSKQFVFKVLDYKGNILAGKKVSISVYYGNKVYKKFTSDSDSSGYVRFACNYPPRTYSVVLNADNGEYKVKLTVKKAASKLIASKKTFKVNLKTKKYTVTLKNNKNQAIKSAKVTLKVKGKTYTAKTNSKGQATFSITKLTKKGTFSAVVKYSGNSYYNSATKSVKITVKK